MKDKYFMCGATVNEDCEIVPVYGITNSIDGLSSIYFDNSPYNIRAVYGIEEELRPLEEPKDVTVRKIAEMIQKNARGKASTILTGEQGLLVIESLEDFKVQVQPFKGFTGNEPVKEYYVDYVELDDDAEEYEDVMELMYSL